MERPDKERWVDMFQTGSEKIPVKPRPHKDPSVQAHVSAYELRLCKFIQVVDSLQALVTLLRCDSVGALPAQGCLVENKFPI